MQAPWGGGAPSQALGELHGRAEAVLRGTLALDPGNARALLRMIDVHRGRGDLAAALKLCRRLVRLDPGHRKARWLSAVLGGGTVPEQKPSGPWPAPFVRIPDFLAPAEGERLLAYAMARRERFAAATTGMGEHRKVRPSRRIGLTASDLACQDIKPWLIPRVREVLPEVMARLREEWFDPGQVRIRLQMNAYHDGGFGRPHRDPETLLGVCYFHRLPKPFCGGDLLLYDTDTAKEGYRPLEFSRIEPTANGIVFFRSHDYFHEVTPVATETDDFADGRFAVNVIILAAPRKRAPPLALSPDRCRPGSA